MLEKLEVIKKALDRGNQKGIFTLEEASLLLTNYVQLKQSIEESLDNKLKQTNPSIDVIDDVNGD